MNRVLLIEDNRSIKEIYTRILEEEGYDVTGIEDGDIAKSEIEKAEWDILLLDVMLPKLDGLTLLKHLVKNPNLASRPVLIISNVNEPEFISQCKALGVKDYIIKAEVLPSDILQRVQTFLPVKK